MTKITKAKFKIAVQNTGGIMSRIAENLQCDRSAVYTFCRKHPDMMELRRNEEEKIIDIAENSLFIQAQNREQWAVKYLLSTKGKKRGYIEKQEVETNISGNVGVDLTKINLAKDYVDGS